MVYMTLTRSPLSPGFSFPSKFRISEKENRVLHGLPARVIFSVKPFKSKNRDKIDLDAPNPNLKKGCDRDFLRQPNL